LADACKQIIGDMEENDKKKLKILADHFGVSVDYFLE